MLILLCWLLMEGLGIWGLVTLWDEAGNYRFALIAFVLFGAYMVYKCIRNIK